jgi:hypothetical protein
MVRDLFHGKVPIAHAIIDILGYVNGMSDDLILSIFYDYVVQL